MGFVENIWWLLVLLGVMILIHELGHYWAARYFDIRVDTFSFGFGPRLFGFRKGETDFRFSLILFGGYVRMAGEHPGDEEDPRGFLAKPRWQRLIVVFAGPAMNIVLAVALMTGLYMFRYPKLANADAPATIGVVAANSAAEKAGVKEGDTIIQIENKKDPNWEDVLLAEVSNPNRELPVILKRGDETVRVVVKPEADSRNGIGVAGWGEQTEIEIASVRPGMDADKQGLKPGDVISSVNGHRIRTIAKLHEIIRGSEGKPVTIEYLRDGQRRVATVTPTFSDADGGPPRYVIGVNLTPRMTYVRLGPVDAFRESIKQNIRGAGLIYQFLRNIIERRMSPKSIEGPIRIAQLSTEAAREGPTSFITLMSTVSLNLAIFNLLPIPILDGGVILLLLIEMVRRRDLSMPVKETFFKLGFVFLMMVVLFVLYNDIVKTLPG